MPRLVHVHRWAQIDAPGKRGYSAACWCGARARFVYASHYGVFGSGPVFVSPQLYARMQSELGGHLERRGRRVIRDLNGALLLGPEAT